MTVDNLSSGVYKKTGIPLYSLRMNMKDVLSHLQDEQAIIVQNVTFEPDTIDHVVLDTGESLYWVRDNSGRWLSIDIASEELMFFEETDEDVEPADGLVVFQNKDYEFSYEGRGNIVDEDGVELEAVTFKDYESGGEIMRVIVFDVTGDRSVSVGTVVAEDEIGAA